MRLENLCLCLTIIALSFILYCMFVSVIVEPGSIESGKDLTDILAKFAFSKIQRFCWENMRFSESDIVALKKDIDRVTDYYDKVRFYQFPVEGQFVITELRQKKWRRCAFASRAK